MNSLKKLSSALLALVFTVLCFGGMARAAGGEMYLTAERAGDTVTVRLMTGTTVNFGGITGYLGYDRNAFQLVSGKSSMLSFILNVNTGKFVADTAYDLDVPNGEELMYFTFKTTSSFSTSKKYEFTVDLESVYGFDLEDHPWSVGMHMNAYIGSGPAPSPTPSHTSTPKPKTPLPTAAPTPKPNTPAPGATSVPNTPVPSPSPSTSTTSGPATAKPSASTPSHSPKATALPSGVVQPTTAPSAGQPSSAPTQYAVNPSTTNAPTLPTDDPSAEAMHTATYIGPDGSVLYIEQIQHGESLSESTLPEGCDMWTFLGERFDFSSPIYGDVTLIAASSSEAPELPISETDPPAASEAVNEASPSPSESGGSDDESGAATERSILPVIIPVGAALIAALAAFLIIRSRKRR